MMTCANELDVSTRLSKFKLILKTPLKSAFKADKIAFLSCSATILLGVSVLEILKSMFFSTGEYSVLKVEAIEVTYASNLEVSALLTDTIATASRGIALRKIGRAHV